DLGRLLNWQIGGLHAFEDLVHKACEVAIIVECIHTVPDQAAGFRKIPRAYRSNSVLDGESRNRFRVSGKQRVGMNEDCINAPPLDRRKRALKRIGVADLDAFKLHSISFGFTARRCKYLHESWVGRSYENTHFGDAWF